MSTEADDPPPIPGRRWFRVLECAIAGVVVCCAALLAFAAFVRARERDNKLRCKDNLRTLALAMIQYSDDKRFMPHVGRLQNYDGDSTTSDGPKSMRALKWYGYLDDTARFVCPSSEEDQHLEVKAPALSTPRLWFWGQDYAQASETSSPFVDGAPDPTDRDARELSYMYTRRGNNR